MLLQIMRNTTYYYKDYYNLIYVNYKQKNILQSNFV